MSSTPRHRRRWTIRFLQLSPLIALLMLAVVWFSIPANLAVSLMTSASRVDYAQWPMTPEMRVKQLDATEQQNAAEKLHLDSGSNSYNVAIEDAWIKWVESLPVSPSASDVLSPSVAPHATEFAPVSQWERKNGARVWAWVVPAPPQPTKVATAVGDPASLNLLEMDLRNRQFDGDPSGDYAPRNATDLVWSQTGLPGLLRPLDPSVLARGGGVSGSGGGYYTAYYSVTDPEGGLWRVVVVGPVGDADTEPPELSAATLAQLKPQLAGSANRLEHLATSMRINIWVFGPLEWSAIPLRVPQGASAEQAQELGRLVWPSLGVSDQSSYESLPRPFDDRTRRFAGGAAGLLCMTGVNNTRMGAGTMYAPDEVPPQTVAWLAVYDQLPQTAPVGAPARAWSAWRRFVSGWFPFLLGGAVGLVALTLVSAPAAFVYERRMIARERVREEMARMRRDAHDKVYNRLSALSKRVAAASNQVATDTATALTTIAEEIRGTVGELQEILGDEARHTNSALTTVPLAEQLSSVAAAQSARLGVSAVVEAEEAPEVSAELGWDLQCITEEAITNAVRHGKAANVAIALRVEDGALLLTVVDDGSGSAITVPEDAPEGSTGLRGIRDRLVGHGGEFSITANEQGTTLVARVPMPR